ncbi:pesticidal protein [Bacillus thuringiensis]|nr:pesticidal protein [Bacillus thuringiensis]ALL25005.1 pesticidal protein [Bacillus thuringiensis]
MIISNPSSNYPLANNPNTPFQNINYKDFLNMNEEIAPYASSKDVIFSSMNIIRTFMGFAGHGTAGGIVALFTEVLRLLWPNKQDELWESFMKEVEKLIEQEITDAVVSKALAELEGLRNALQGYTDALEAWQNNRSDKLKQLLVYDRFVSTENLFKFAMPSFRVGGFEVPLLTVYAQAANLHLLLLKNSELFGAEWGMQQYEIDLFYNEQKDYVVEYTDHCVKWYTEGLNRLKNASGVKGKVWEEYNRFRREMTIMVLDLLPLFPIYDVRTYPTETVTELTRQIFTDPIGLRGINESKYPDWYGAASDSFSLIENRAVPQPSLFQWLTEFKVYTKYVEPNDKLTILAGHSVTTQYTSYYKKSTFTYGDTSSANSSRTFDLLAKDVYQVDSVAAASKSATWYLAVPEMRLYSINTNNILSEDYFSLSTNIPSSKMRRMYSSEELPIGISDTPIYGDLEEYSHRLSFISEIMHNSGSVTGSNNIKGIIPVLGWTHTSVSPENYIHRDKISQLYAVKAYTTSNVSVVGGPGFLGGNIIKGNNDPASYTGSVSWAIRLDGSTVSRFRLRIPYAAETDGTFSITVRDDLGPFTIKKDFIATMKPGDPLSYGKFEYLEFEQTMSLNNKHGQFFVHTENLKDRNSSVYWNRVEIIPVDENYDNRVRLEKAQKAVNALFTAGRHALQTNVTDYKVDQVSILVDSVSGELYPNEKRELQSLVKYAKRLSYSRNLLLDPTFDSINSSEENGWYGSNGIAIGNGNFVFKGNYLNFSGTNDTQYPTYLYQKIDESKLKEYTRYKLRGFIESSQDLEAYVVRYDAKHETLDVSNNLFPDISPVNACGEPNRCAALPYLDKNPRLECSLIQDGILSDSHSFSLNIDTGSIDSTENVGIWVLFKISTPEGYAKFGNLEVIEYGPVIGEALARVKRQETKWRNKLTQLRTETQAIYTRAKQAIDNLFTNTQDSYLKIGATFASIVAARKIVQSIREAYMSWLSIVPGVNYPIFTELNERVQRAFQLYDVRNVVRNGRFLSGVSDWIVTSDVKVQEENGNNVLVLSNWDAQVLQCLKLYQDRGYILRVTARKEGLGEGYITITDEEGHTDQLTFGTCEEIDASNTFVSTGYITKELEFFPDTEKVRIEIGETEGIFKVESVELFLMEDLC